MGGNSKHRSTDVNALRGVSWPQYAPTDPERVFGEDELMGRRVNGDVAHTCRAVGW